MEASTENTEESSEVGRSYVDDPLNGNWPGSNAGVGVNTLTVRMGGANGLNAVIQGNPRNGTFMDTPPNPGYRIRLPGNRLQGLDVQFATF